jgi:hypothetical protein
MGHIAKLMAPAMPQRQVISDFTHIEQVTSPIVMAAVVVAAIATMKGSKKAVKQVTIKDQKQVKAASMT